MLFSLAVRCSAEPYGASGRWWMAAPVPESCLREAQAQGRLYGALPTFALPRLTVHNGSNGGIHGSLFDTRPCLPRRSASVAATKWSFDVATPTAIVVRAIANDRVGEAGRAVWPR